MPIINGIFALQGGPRIKMAFGVSEPRAVAMTSAGIPIPSLFVGDGLIDTGASCTAVDDAVIQHLGVPPIGTETISTPSSVNHVTNIYDMMVAVLGPEGDHYVEFNIRVFSSLLANQGICALLGRDILSKCLLNYNGPSGTLSLAY